MLWMWTKSEKFEWHKVTHWKWTWEFYECGQKVNNLNDIKLQIENEHDECGQKVKHLNDIKLHFWNEHDKTQKFCHLKMNIMIP